MDTYVFLADYENFKAGDTVFGYEEAIPMGNHVFVNLIAEINGQEKLIPIKFVEPVESSSFINKVKTSEALYWVGVIIIVAILFLAAKSFFKWK